MSDRHMNLALFIFMLSASLWMGCLAIAQLIHAVKP